MHPHVPLTQDPVQQSLPNSQLVPTIAQVGAPLWHVPGLPVQPPAQHSSFVVQDPPAATHVEVQTETPAPFAAHDPLQHASPALHGASRGRHGPEPKSHRPLVESQSAQHGGTAIEVQDSPVGRQRAAVMTHKPIAVAHSPEQQSPFELQASPASVHRVVPHVPALQPSEQQSAARVHGAPSTRQ